MAATDNHLGDPVTMTYPADNAETVTPSDSTTLSNVSRGLYVGTSGDVTVLMQGGQTVTFTAVPAGTVLPIQIQRVNSTNTTASDMVSLY